MSIPGTFNNSVHIDENKGGEGITDKDQKLDLGDGVDEQQQKVIDNMTADNAGGSDDDLDSGDDELEFDDDSTEESDEEDGDSLDEEDSDDESDDFSWLDDGDDTDVEPDSKPEKPTEDEQGDKPGKEGEAVDQKPQLDSAFSKGDDVDVTKLSDSERENLAITNLYNKNKGVLPKSLLENWQKFQESGNNAFLHTDNHLYKLVQAVKKTNESLAIEDRLDIAFSLAFKEEFSKQEQKKGQVKAEIANQKVNKAVSPSSGNKSDKGNAPSFNRDQIIAARKMGVKLPGMK